LIKEESEGEAARSFARLGEKEQSRFKQKTAIGEVALETRKIHSKKKSFAQKKFFLLTSKDRRARAGHFGRESRGNTIVGARGICKWGAVCGLGDKKHF